MRPGVLRDDINNALKDAMKAKDEGYKGYKIHFGSGQHKDGPPIPGYVGHMEEIKLLEAARKHSG